MQPNCGAYQRCLRRSDLVRLCRQNVDRLVISKGFHSKPQVLRPPARAKTVQFTVQTTVVDNLSCICAQRASPDLRRVTKSPVSKPVNIAVTLR